jgi:hypothetical protein
MSEELNNEIAGTFSEEEISSIVEENPEVLETPEPPEPAMSEEDQAIFDEINDVELLELEDAPQWKDPEPFVYVHPGEPGSDDDVIDSPETPEIAPQPSLGYDNNGVLGSTAPVEQEVHAAPVAPAAPLSSDKVAVFSTRNASWGEFGKVYNGYNILSPKAAEAWLTRDHCRIATPEEVAKEFGN